jgi:hypothetical protein
MQKKSNDIEIDLTMQMQEQTPKEKEIKPKEKEIKPKEIEKPVEKKEEVTKEPKPPIPQKKVIKSVSSLFSDKNISSYDVSKIKDNFVIQKRTKPVKLKVDVDSVVKVKKKKELKVEAKIKTYTS